MGTKWPPSIHHPTYVCGKAASSTLSASPSLPKDPSQINVLGFLATFFMGFLALSSQAPRAAAPSLGRGVETRSVRREHRSEEEQRRQLLEKGARAVRLTVSVKVD